MFEIINYPFFQKALLWWLLIWIAAWIVWVFIVLRRQVQIGHTIANSSLFWIVIWIALWLNFSVASLIFAIIWWLLIFLIGKTKKVTSDSTLEFISQIAIAGAIFMLWILPWVKIDINSFLFWSILSINNQDLLTILFVFLSLLIIFKYVGKKFLAVSLSPEITKTSNISVDLYNILFTLIVASLIWVSIKIFWTLLIWAFIVIPANIWKILGNSFRQMTYIAVTVNIVATISGLFISAYYDTSPWASIVLIMGGILIISLLWKGLRKH